MYTSKEDSRRLKWAKGKRNYYPDAALLSMSRKDTHLHKILSGRIILLHIFTYYITYFILILCLINGNYDIVAMKIEKKKYRLIPTYKAWLR